MNGLATYFPSAQFALILGSVALSGGTIFAAHQFTKQNSEPSSTLVAQNNTQSQSNWQQTLRDIQSQNSSYTLPPAPSENAVQNLLAAAKTPNVTETIGRTLLVNLSNAKSQGLGDDIPTQDALIAGAAQQLTQERGAPIYTSADLQTVAANPESLKAYGNIFISTITAHPQASYYETLLAIGYATDNQDKTKLTPLTATGKAYTDMSKALISIPVPQTLAPLHLQIINNFARIAQTYPDMQQLIEDPLKALSAIQLYESLIQETGRMFTNIAQQLSSNGILFNTSEPGNAWNSFLPSS